MPWCAIVEALELMNKFGEGFFLLEQFSMLPNLTVLMDIFWF